MKKIALVLLVALCLVSVLSVGVFAAMPETFESTWTTDGVGYQLPPFLLSMLESFFGIIPMFRDLIVTYLGSLAFAAYGGIAFILVLIAAFGYRFLTLMRGILGLVAGLLVGYIGWNLLISWTGVPAIILDYKTIAMWSVIGVSALVGALLTIILRRLGTAFSFALVTTVCLLPCVRHIFVLAGLLVFLVIFSLFKSRASVILLASFGIPIFLLYFLIGPNGFYPINLSMYVSTVVDPLLLLGLVIGTIFSMVHFRVSRKVRA